MTACGSAAYGVRVESSDLIALLALVVSALALVSSVVVPLHLARRQRDEQNADAVLSEARRRAAFDITCQRVPGTSSREAVAHNVGDMDALDAEFRTADHPGGRVYALLNAPASAAVAPGGRLRTRVTLTSGVTNTGLFLVWHDGAGEHRQHVQNT